MFIYEKFEELPRYRHDIIRGHVMRAIKERKLIENLNSADALFHKEKTSILERSRGVVCTWVVMNLACSDDTRVVLYIM